MEATNRRLQHRIDAMQALHDLGTELLFEKELSSV